MDSHFKDGTSYIDGVPMRISPKFIPPRPIGLPVSIDSRTPSELLRIQYDFSFEKHVLETTQKRLLELKNAKEKGKTNPDPSSSSQEVPPPSVQCARPLPNVILQPKLKIDYEPQINNPANKNLKINLSDFENDSSSPFDLMELKTINDLEVLNSVFQGIHTENTNVQASGGATVAKSVSFPLPQNSWEETSVKQPDEVVKDLNNDVLEHPTELTHEVNHPNPSYLRGGAIGYTSLSQVPCISSSPSKNTAMTSLKGSKSYSDFHSLPEDAIVAEVKERSQTPPSTPITLPVEEHILPIEENYFAEQSKNETESKNECPDAYEELDNTSRNFVDSITEMGFSRGQVARSVKHLGMDEKKVIEHLCQIQTLEESGYESWEAEAALHLHDYNREQAKAFLDLVIQFQDLGFEKDAVKKALVQNKNDWNKTIDALLP